jgi:hypothetical protein
MFFPHVIQVTDEIRIAQYSFGVAQTEQGRQKDKILPQAVGSLASCIEPRRCGGKNAATSKTCKNLNAPLLPLARLTGAGPGCETPEP